MALARWKQIGRTELFANRWWKYWKDEFELPDAKRREYHFVHTNGASMVVPLTAMGTIVMVNQFRYLNQRESLEFPCCGVKEKADYDSTAAAELAEEAGYVSRNWMIAGEFNPFNGVTDEITRVYIARELTPVTAHPDETEEFEIHTLTPDEIDSRIVSGVIWDGMTLAAWGIARNFL